LGLVRFLRKSKLEMRGLIFSVDALLEGQPPLFFVVELTRLVTVDIMGTCGALALF
jgi:hypothetical protein